MGSGRRAGRLTPLVVAAALLLGAAGCSDSADGPDPAPSPSPAPSVQDRRPAETDATVTVTPSAPPVTDEYVPARSARELARRLVAAEELIRDRDVTGELLDAAAFETQLLYQQLARTPRWQQVVIGLVPEHYRPTVRAHLDARSSLRSIVTTLSDELPAWRIVRPAPLADLMSFYAEGQRRYGVPWQILAAINFVETGFGKIDGLSSAGARGPMQFIPSTWAAYGEGDIEDPHDAIVAAARYLEANGGSGGPADVRQALFAYNNHEGYVDGVLAYTELLRRDPAALRGLYRYQIVYLSTLGEVWLPVGYDESRPVPVRRYVAQHPERHLGTTTD